jgi:hypothetical protein
MARTFATLRLGDILIATIIAAVAGFNFVLFSIFTSAQAPVIDNNRQQHLNFQQLMQEDSFASFYLGHRQSEDHPVLRASARESTAKVVPSMAELGAKFNFDVAPPPSIANQRHASDGVDDVKSERYVPQNDGPVQPHVKVPRLQAAALALPPTNLAASRQTSPSLNTRSPHESDQAAATAAAPPPNAAVPPPPPPPPDSAAAPASGRKYRPEDLPVAVVACRRAGYLRRALASLLAARGAAPARAVVFQDGDDAGVAAAAAAAGVRLVRHAPAAAGDGAARIAAHYRAVLEGLFRMFPAAPYGVVVEEDLVPARDV